MAAEVRTLGDVVDRELLALGRADLPEDVRGVVNQCVLAQFPMLTEGFEAETDGTGSVGGTVRDAIKEALGITEPGRHVDSMNA